MKRFVLRCEHEDFLTRSIVDAASLADESNSALLDACKELAEHVLEVHGGPTESWHFTAIEVQEGAGALWVTEVVGEQP